MERRCQAGSRASSLRRSLVALVVPALVALAALGLIGPTGASPSTSAGAADVPCIAARVYLPLVVSAGPPPLTPPPSPATPTPCPSTPLLPPSLTLALSPQPSLAPGQPLTLSWTVTNLASPQGLVLQARAPGNTYPPGALARDPGIAPPTGAVSYLQADGTWSSGPATYQASAASGRVTVSLPSSAAGEWSLTASLTDPSTGTVGTLVSQPLVVAGTPALLLRLDRPLASSTTPVQASVTLAGPASSNVQLDAVLALPDGIQVALPGFSSDLADVYAGPLQPQTFALLDRPLGAGSYHLGARLYDQTTGKLLGMADAGLAVCDVTTSVSGKVTDASGSALGGNSPSLAVVSALDVDAGTDVQAATIGVDGSYALALPPGRYLLHALVVDAAGVHRGTSAVVVADCSGTAQALNLPTQTSPFPTAGAAARASMTDLAAGGPSVVAASIGTTAAASCATDPSITRDGRPAPVLFVAGIGDGVSTDVASLLGESFEVSVRAGAPGVATNSPGAAAALLSLLRDQQLLGIDAPSGGPNLAAALGGDFALTLQARSAGPIKTLTATLYDPVTAKIYWRNIQNVPAFDDTAFPAVDALAQKVSQPAAGTSLFCFLRALQPVPTSPLVRVQVTPHDVALGKQVNVTLTLTDADGTPDGGNLPVHLQIQAPGVSPTDFDGTTDATGTYTVSHPAGLTVGRGTVIGSFSRNGQTWTSEPTWYWTQPQTDLTLSSPTGLLAPGGTMKVTVSLTSNGTPLANQSVDLTSLDGSLDDNSPTTDQNGLATVTYTAGKTSAPDVIHASYTPSGSTTPETAALHVLVDGGVVDNLNAQAAWTADGGANALKDDVFVGGAQVPNINVTFSVQGSGTIATPTTQTDATGEAVAIYVAPASGSGTDTITATSYVDGQSYTKTTTINYQPAVPTCQQQSSVKYCVTDLGTLGGATSTATAINASGQVVGYSDTSTGDSHAFLWQNGQMTDLGTLVGGTQSRALGINSAGQIAGWSEGPPDQYGRRSPVPVVWSGGSIQPLTFATGSSWVNSGMALSINDNGLIAGWQVHSGGFYGIVVWSATTLAVQNPPGSTPRGYGACGLIYHPELLDVLVMIDPSGNVIYNSYYSQGPAPFLCNPSLNNGNGGIVSLVGTPVPVTISAQAEAVNSSGQVLVVENAPTSQSFVWQNGPVGSPLPAMGCACALNSKGQIVSPGGIWQNGTPTSLISLVDPYAGVTGGVSPAAINDAGQIVGVARINGAAHAILLTPK